MAADQTVPAPEDVIQAPASAPAFLAHNTGDTVAVAVQDVEPSAQAGTQHRVVFMDSDREMLIAVRERIPLGHKVALQALPADADVIEYGVRIGTTRTVIEAGQHVHTHNIRSARWQNSL